MSRVAAAKHDEYAQGRRELILDAALQVFANASFADAKMDGVAAIAGLSKGALYLYFPTKEALLRITAGAARHGGLDSRATAICRDSFFD
jgi:AcrR family transcriptional regulator